MSAPHAALDAAALRSACTAETPLDARLEPWMVELVARPDELAALLAEHGSPLNLHHPGAFGRNAAELRAAATAHGLDLGIFFARKANKCIGFVEEASRLGLGVDVASEAELDQTLAAGADPRRVVVTAAVKPASLLRRCVEAGVTVVIDNADELALYVATVAALGVQARSVPMAFRIAPSRLGAGRPRTRFGLDAADVLALLDRLPGPVQLSGVHFHLDGYSAADRAAAIGEALELVDRLRALGHAVDFLDIGGGIPMSYLSERAQWERFWAEHRDAARGRRRPLTFQGHALGVDPADESVASSRSVYPYWQSPTRGDWLAGLLGAETRVDERGVMVATAIAERRLELRCEPGRSLLDGCGLTAARVEFRKPYEDGAELVGLAMNRTQCRSTSDDFLVDPLLVRVGGREAERGPCEAFLVGAYCIERELLTWRRLRFPHGVEPDDIVVFPNTAGYLMHILESASHQIPLARNAFVDGDGGVTVDPIDV